MTTRRTNRTTQEIPAETVAELLATIGGQDKQLINMVSYRTECAKTQHEMPAIRETRPASKWSFRSLSRLLADVMAVQS
jgi:hypothetical protein